MWINKLWHTEGNAGQIPPFGADFVHGRCVGHNDRKRSPCEEETGGRRRPGKELEGKGAEAGRVRTERAGGAGARTVGEMKVTVDVFTDDR